MQNMFAIVGPTGAGKSALGIKLALLLKEQGRNAEIISADAMQLYRGMDIGTAKVTSSEQQGVRHHMLDVLEPYQEASVSEYQKQVLTLIAELEATQTVPILVGGSGLYVNSVLYEMHFAPHDDAVRQELEASYEKSGIEPLLQRLLVLDPHAKTNVDLQNPRRIIRALEVILISGKPLAAHLPEKPKLLRPTTVVGVTEERSILVERLAKRVEDMWESGMLQEVKALIQHGIRNGKTASQAIGYAQALAQLDGEINETEAIEQTQLLTRRYARRQVSWFKRLPEISWLSTAESQDLKVQLRILSGQLSI